MSNMYRNLFTYIYISIGVLVIALLNSIYFVANFPNEQRLATTIVYVLTYFLGALIFVYFLGQKKYFNNP